MEWNGIEWNGKEWNGIRIREPDITFLKMHLCQVVDYGLRAKAAGGCADSDPDPQGSAFYFLLPDPYPDLVVILKKDRSKHLHKMLFGGS
jgi:hypothetical protein